MKPDYCRVAARALARTGILLVIALTGVIAHAEPVVIAVQPTGDTSGQADARQIENALRSVGMDGIVQLDAGDFYLSRSVSVEGFRGVFRGAGKDLTTIEAVQDSKGNQAPTFEGVRVRYLDGYCNPREGFASTSPSKHCLEYPMFYFEDPVGRLTVSDLTLKVEVDRPVSLDCCVYQGLLALVLVTMGEDVDTHFSNLRLIGGGGGPGSVLFGIRLYGGRSLDEAFLGPSGWPSGNHSLTSSEIFISTNFGYAATFLSNSLVTIGGDRKSDANVFDSRGAVRLIDMDGSDIRIGGNTIIGRSYVARSAFADGFGVLMYQVRTENSTNLLVDNNSIEAIGDISPATFSLSYGVNLLDGFSPDPTLRPIISNNRLVGSRIFGLPIFSNGGIRGDALVSNNRFEGQALVAVLSGLPPAGGIPILGPDSGWLLHGNSFQGFDALVSHLFLGPETRDWTVVGGGESLSVNDLGINNTIVGATAMGHEPPGPELQKAAEQRREFREIF